MSKLTVLRVRWLAVLLSQLCTMVTLFAFIRNPSSQVVTVCAWTTMFSLVCMPTVTQILDAVEERRTR